MTKLIRKYLNASGGGLPALKEFDGILYLYDPTTRTYRHGNYIKDENGSPVLATIMLATNKLGDIVYTAKYPSGAEIPVTKRDGKFIDSMGRTYSEHELPSTEEVYNDLTDLTKGLPREWVGNEKGMLLTNPLVWNSLSPNELDYILTHRPSILDRVFAGSPIYDNYINPALNTTNTVLSFLGANSEGGMLANANPAGGAVSLLAQARKNPQLINNIRQTMLRGNSLGSVIYNSAAEQNTKNWLYRLYRDAQRLGIDISRLSNETLERIINTSQLPYRLALPELNALRSEIMTLGATISPVAEAVLKTAAPVVASVQRAPSNNRLSPILEYYITKLGLNPADIEQLATRVSTSKIYSYLRKQEANINKYRADAELAEREFLRLGTPEAKEAAEIARERFKLISTNLSKYNIIDLWEDGPRLEELINMTKPGASWNSRSTNAIKWLEETAALGNSVPEHVLRAALEFNGITPETIDEVARLYSNNPQVLERITTALKGGTPEWTLLDLSKVSLISVPQRATADKINKLTSVITDYYRNNPELGKIVLDNLSERTAQNMILDLNRDGFVSPKTFRQGEVILTGSLEPIYSIATAPAATPTYRDINGLAHFNISPTGYRWITELNRLRAGHGALFALEGDGAVGLSSHPMALTLMTDNLLKGRGGVVTETGAGWLNLNGFGRPFGYMPTKRSNGQYSFKIRPIEELEGTGFGYGSFYHEPTFVSPEAKQTLEHWNKLYDEWLTQTQAKSPTIRLLNEQQTVDLVLIPKYDALRRAEEKITGKPSTIPNPRVAGNGLIQIPSLLLLLYKQGGKTKLIKNSRKK